MFKKMKATSLERKRARSGYIFILPLIIGLVFIFIPMIIQLFLTSVSIFDAANAKFLYGKAGLAYYEEMFLKDAWFMQLYVNTTIRTLIDFICILFFSFFVALLLNQNFKGQTIARIIFFLPVLLMAGILGRIDAGNMASALGGLDTTVDIGAVSGVTLPNVSDILVRNNLLDNRLLTILTEIINRMGVMTTQSGVQILLFLAGLHSISPSVYEAASIEGCSGWEMFWKITLPMTSPIILLNSVYTLIETMTNTNNHVVGALLNMTTRLRFSESASRSVLYLISVSVFVALIFLIGKKFVFYRE